MSAVMMRGQKVKTDSWSSVFPNEQCTEQRSVLFVKKLLAVSVSNIMYLRAIFPESAFADRAIDDLQLKILRDDSSCPGASDVVHWVRGCFEAFEKRYLRQVIMGIYKDPSNDETLIESYTFRFSYQKSTTMNLYRNNEHIAAAESTSETKKATLALLRTLIILLQTLRPLPDDVMLTMKLLYYDEVTPLDYEPPGFQRAKSDCFQYETETVNINVGDVRTSFHALKLRIKTDAEQFKVSSIPASEPSESPIPASKDQPKIIDEIVPETQSGDMPHQQHGLFPELLKESKDVIVLQDDKPSSQNYRVCNDLDDVNGDVNIMPHQVHFKSSLYERNHQIQIIYVNEFDKSKKKKPGQGKRSSQNMKSTSSNTATTSHSAAMESLSQKTTQMYLASDEKEKSLCESNNSIGRRLTRSAKRRTASAKGNNGLKFDVDETQDISSQEPEPGPKRLKASSTLKKVLV